MKKILSIFCCLFVLLTIVSCGSGKPIVLQNETTKTIIETVHDTVFKIEKDSSSLEALLECQNGNVVIKQIVQGEPGRTLNSPKVRIADNLLKRAQELLARYKNTHEANTIIKTLPPIEVNRLTDWQKAQINLFRIYAVLTLLFGAWVFIKSKI